MSEGPEASTSRIERFVSEQHEAWACVSRLLRSAPAFHETSPKITEVLAAESPAAAADLFGQACRVLIGEAVEAYDRERPMRRALEAIEDFGDPALAVRRARIDGELQAVMAQALASLPALFRIWLSHDQTGAEAAWLRWRESAEKLDRRGAAVLSRYEEWAKSAATLDPGLSASHAARHDRHLAFWWRRQRSVASTLSHAGGLARAGVELLRLAGRMTKEIDRERMDLLTALRAQAAYLDDWRGGPFDPPEMNARIASAEEWVERWWSSANRFLPEALPSTVERFLPRSPIPSIFHRSDLIAPAEELRAALRRAAAAGFRASFLEVTEGHLAIAREIKRASETVAYASEASAASGTDLLSEAVANVRERLREREQASVQGPTGLAKSFTRAIVDGVLQAAREASAGPIQRAGFRFQRRLQAWLRESGAGAAGQAESAAIALGRLVFASYDSFLVKIGWKTPARTPVPPVAVRTDFREALRLASAPQALPALYRRLFRLAPVDDPRFLIGREEELDGFRQALNAWRNGRRSACVLVGARGSGKTSLLNCAIPSVFAGETVLRGQFRERILTPSGVEERLAGLLHAPAGTSLLDFLSNARRVVIIEEVERCFLKTIGGFDAIRRLLEIVDLSVSTTLWILVLNIRSAELLKAALDVDRQFSHVVNSMSVWREDLVRAILQRHNLSGMKLVFAPPAESGLRARLGLRTDPQKAFFDSLYAESGGNFRSAFQLWQASVERAEGGTIYMRQPLSPSLDPLRKQLSQQDHFTLLSVLQHGSLTPAELAVVLAEPESTSRLRMQRLSAIGLLEPDPDHPGLRVEPEASRFVAEVLQSVNLI